MQKKIPRRQAGRPTRDEAIALSERIFDIATEQFLKLGYSETTFDAIAARVGTSKGAIYSRFPDKISLFSAVCERLISSYYQADVVDLEDKLPLGESLIKQASALISAGLHPKTLELWDMITVDVPRHPELAKSIRMAWDLYVAQLVRYFESRVERGLLKLSNPRGAAEIFARLIFSPIHIALLQGSKIPDRKEMDRHIEDAVHIFLGGIGRLEIECLNHRQVRSREQ